jgi:Kef-type K+ transport system membrane component KefB
VALFLFAGLEVDFEELRREVRVLSQHVAVGLAALLIGAALVRWFLQLDLRPATLLALALLTPSTGFILDSLPGLGLTSQERFWVKSKAIATELVALGAMFVILQSRSLGGLGTASAVMLALVALLPLGFRWFAKVVLPYAPKSEFAFLLMVAVFAALVTRRLGVYYLVGAFIVGIAAQRFRQRLPAMASDQMLHAVEVFASVFVPFYFFATGLGLRAANFSPAALWLGTAFILIAVPVRILLVAVHRRLALGESLAHGSRIGLAMVPTLVFGLVIADILRDSFVVPDAVIGGVIVYTLAATLLPGLLLQRAGAPVVAEEAGTTPRGRLELPVD